MYLTPVRMRMISLTKSIPLNWQIGVTFCLVLFVKRDHDYCHWQQFKSQSALSPSVGLVFLVVPYCMLVVSLFRFFPTQTAGAFVTLFWSWHLFLIHCVQRYLSVDQVALNVPPCMLIVGYVPFPVASEPQQLVLTPYLYHCVLLYPLLPLLILS